MKVVSWFKCVCVCARARACMHLFQVVNKLLNKLKNVLHIVKLVLTIIKGTYIFRCSSGHSLDKNNKPWSFLITHLIIIAVFFTEVNYFMKKNEMVKIRLFFKV